MPLKGVQCTVCLHIHTYYTWMPVLFLRTRMTVPTVTTDESAGCHLLSWQLTLKVQSSLRGSTYFYLAAYSFHSHPQAAMPYLALRGPHKLRCNYRHLQELQASATLMSGHAPHCTSSSASTCPRHKPPGQVKRKRNKISTLRPNQSTPTPNPIIHAAKPAWSTIV